MGNKVIVSGVGIPDDVIIFPSGQIPDGSPGSNLHAFLVSANATFGYNVTSHSLEMEFIPSPRDEPIYHGASGNLPSIGTFLEMNIGDFYFNGRVIHADYANGSNGTVVRTTIEDDRQTLNQIKIHTEDLGESTPSGVVSVGRAYRKLKGLTDSDGNVVDQLVFEYNKIDSQGATYGQILDALQLAVDEGVINFSISRLPTLNQIQANIGGSAQALRFKFNMTSLLQAITRVLQDAAYDWYWNMTAAEVNLVNKKISFSVEETDLISLINEVSGYGDIAEGTQRLTYGQDAVMEPTRFRLLGGRQQGFINSPLLSPVDGLDTTALDNNITFTPAWTNISIGFYDADGYYRTYTPTDKELQMALAGIEHWTYYKIYQESEFGEDADAGSVAAQHETFQSRYDPLETLSDLAGNNAEQSIRIISNRLDETHNWVIDFYNRASNHAQRHYGRSYIVTDVMLNETSGVFTPIDAAWCNVENQINGQAFGVSGSPGPFIDDYKINSTLGPISPFITDDYRVASHIVLPADTVYGARGDQPPAGFAEWTEDAPPFNPTGDGSHYVPCDITVVGGKVKNPRSDDLYSFEDYADGTLWVQLPIIAGTMKEDGVLANLATLIEMSNKVGSEGLVDIFNPTQLIEPYATLTGVAIPVESRIRYGQNFPDPWAMGNVHYLRGEDVTVDDSFVPWNFFPTGDDTSLKIMTDRAVRKIQGRVVDHVFSSYADISQEGLPTLTFDSFANQNINSSGLFGERTHGVTDFNISLNAADGYSTRYKIASYFGEFGKEAPLGEETRALLDGILHPIDFTTLNLVNPIPPPPGTAGVPSDYPPLFFMDFGEKKQAVKVSITEVNRVFTIGYATNPSLYEGPERYRGRTSTGDYLKPPSYTGDDDFIYGAVCVDGFLSLGDDAMYHNDEYELSSGAVTQRYFTAGRPLGSASIVKIYQVNTSDPTKFDVVLEGEGVKASATDTEKRAMIGVEVLGGGSARVGTKSILCGEDDSNKIAPGASNEGIFVYSSDAGGVPVQVEALANAGTGSATATVRKISSSLSADPAETAVTGVVPFPYPGYAQVGDLGLLASASDGTNVVYIGRFPLGNA